MKLAVIGTFYGRHENSFPLLHRLLVDSTRRPDEAWLMCETMRDADVILAALKDLHDLDLAPARPDGVHVVVAETPRTLDGAYGVIPYSNKINLALDLAQADLFVYLDNGSMPAPTKYDAMAAALEQHPGWGAVYCGQERTGYNPGVHHAGEPVQDAYCVLNYTQVMHRRTVRRWPTDMRLANPDLADATFWRELHRDVGCFYPVAAGTVLDWHRMDGQAATGL